MANAWAAGQMGSHTQKIFMSSASKYAVCSPGVLGAAAAAARLQMAAWRLPQLIMWAAKNTEAPFQKTSQRLRDQGNYWLPLPSAQNISWHEFNRPPTASQCLFGRRMLCPQFFSRVYSNVSRKVKSFQPQICLPASSCSVKSQNDSRRLWEKEKDELNDWL